MNILIGGILQESNTFSEASSTVADFERYYFRLGDQLAQAGPERSELNGFYQAAREEGVTLLPTLYTCSVSSGRVPRHTLNELLRILSEQIERQPACDGVVFALHGAWAAEDNDDPDGEVIEAIRRQVGPDVPIVVSLDSHANITRKMAEHVQGIVGYRTFPHIDHMETGYRAAKLLFSIVRNEIRPHLHVRKVPMIVQAENHQTYSGPMFELWKEATAGEQNGDSIATSLFAVQPWLDVEEMGCSVVVVGENDDRAAAEASRLAGMMWAKRETFDVPLYTVAHIVEQVLEERPVGPVIVSDSADSPGAGSPGDSNHVLRQLLALHAEEKWRCLLSMVDAPAARQAAAAGVGSRVRLTVGHTISRGTGTPLEIEGTVTRLGDGKFRFGGGAVANMEATMGVCAVVAIGKISLLLMENPTFTGDPAMYRSVGLEPSEADLVLVKSASQFRAEYEPLSAHIYILDTPGASTPNLKSLSFRSIPRPMYPFDDPAAPDSVE